MEYFFVILFLVSFFIISFYLNSFDFCFLRCLFFLFVFVLLYKLDSIISSFSVLCYVPLFLFWFISLFIIWFLVLYYFCFTISCKTLRVFVYGSLPLCHNILWNVHFMYWNWQLPHPLRVRTAHFSQLRMRCMEWLWPKFNFRFYIDAYTRTIYGLKLVFWVFSASEGLYKIEH